MRPPWPGLRARRPHGTGGAPGVAHVRGRGLLLGAEITPRHSPVAREGIAQACLDRVFVTNGVTPTTLRLTPPFIITDDQIDEAVGIIASVLEEG